jgi:hypothetical protein
MEGSLKRADRVEFVATTIPGGGQMRKALPLWDDIDLRYDPDA